jgi:DNA-binding XRE family transcriptional regulator
MYTRYIDEATTTIKVRKCNYMKKQIIAKFEYDGLGFPIILLNFPVVEVRGVLIPDIDYNQLQRNVLLALCRKPLPLTGNEIRFIRQYLQMNYTDFANRFGVTHASVIHWEKSKNAFAKIQPTSELCIRLCVLDVLHAKDKLFRETFRKFNYLEFKTQKKQVVEEYLTLDSNFITNV